MTNEHADGLLGLLEDTQDQLERVASERDLAREELRKRKDGGWQFCVFIVRVCLYIFIILTINKYGLFDGLGSIWGGLICGLLLGFIVPFRILSPCLGGPR